MSDALPGSGIQLGRTISREELEENAAMYSQWVQRSGLPEDITCVIVLAPRGHEEMGVCGIVHGDPENAKKILEKSAKRMNRNRIVRPI